VLRLLTSPKWVALTIACLLFLPAFNALSNWQWGRLHQRQAYNHTILTSQEQPEVKLRTLLNTNGKTVSVSPKSEWRTVDILGTWDVAGEVLVRKQSLESELGLWVITPLVQANGTIVLVNRGWVAAANSAIDSPKVSPPPSGQVRVLGRVRLVKPRMKTKPNDLPANQIDQIIPKEIFPEKAVLTNAYIEMTSSSPDSLTKGLTEIPAPEVTEGPHRSYALQWIFFAIMTVIGWGVLLRSDYLATKIHADSVGSSDSTGEFSTSAN
jgi:cytochrome oxidase assembly protein ShyY1